MGTRKGMLFIFSAPSGAGKTTLVNAVTRADPGVRTSVSHTTRKRRPGEVDGQAYHFVDVAEFDRLVAAGAFLEHAFVFGNKYGTSRHWVESELASGRDVILEIDWQGASQVRKLVPHSVSIFILPPGLDALEERLRARGDAAGIIGDRMEKARAEISHYREYDYLVFNDVLEDAQRELIAIIQASRCSYAMQKGPFDARVERMLR